MKNMLLIKNGTIHDAIHESPFQGDILIEGSKIKSVGETLDAPEATIFSANGLDIWPGFVDAHSHLGLFGSGIMYEGDDGNEMNDHLTPHLRAIDGFNPMDEAVRKAALGGVTTVAVGPGSANVLGGTFMAVKTMGTRVDRMVVRDPVAMKCAFGENPKRCYKSRSISTRMTTSAIFREILFRAKEYKERLEYAAGDLAKRPPFDARLDALLPVLRKEIPLKAHAHQANDIFNALRIAHEFHLNITLEHVTEGHLIAEELARENVPMAVGPTLGHPGKFELQHKSFETARILTEAGCKVSIITDAPVIPQEFLPICAGLAIKAGMKPFDALRSITIHPARHIGLEKRLGSIEPEKDADLVLTKGSPFEIGCEIQAVFINGNNISAPPLV